MRTAEMRVEFEVKEELPKGISVGRIPIKPGFMYRFNEHVEHFEINGTTGEIKTAAVIDREALQEDTFNLVVLSSQPTYPVEVRIRIRGATGSLFYLIHKFQVILVTASTHSSLFNEF